MSTVSNAQAGSARMTPTWPGSPDEEAAPASRATVPAAIAGGTSGTATRFTRGARSASRPKATSTTGNVAASAAKETPRLSQSQPGSAPPRHCRSRSVAGVPQAIRPAVASDESWKPASPTSEGSTNSITTAAHPSAAAALPARPDSRARVTDAVISAARMTDADAPVRTV